MSAPALPQRYRVDRVLGRGATGEVLGAWDMRLACPVAIKVSLPHRADDKRFRRLFGREIRLAARLVHPHIVPLHDAGVAADGAPFLAMALAEGGSFAAFRAQPPPWPQLLRLTLEVLDALAFIHSRGVLHRDLKPENILLHRGPDQELHAWVADLGAANLADDMPQEQVIGGTPMYMSPEQAMGDVAVLSPAADLYALGAMLKEFVTGAAPFVGTNLIELQNSKERAATDWKPRAGYALPQGAREIINVLLKVDPLERYDLAADLRSALLGIAPLESEPGGALMARTWRTGLEDAISHSAAAHPGGLPRWQQPRPPPFPQEPPPEPGRGYQARASLGLFLVRQPALVGREELRRRLWGLAQEVLDSGQPQVVFLVGEAGAGKSRLVESLASRLEEGGWMDHVELRHQSPAGPTDGLQGALARWLRPDAGSREPVDVRTLRRLARWRGCQTDKERRDAVQIARRLLKLDEKDQARPADIRWLLYEWLEALSWRGGVLLWIEDAQWAAADEGLTFAEGLVRSRGTRPIPALVVATLRSEALEEDAALRSRVEALLTLGAVKLEVPLMGPGAIREVLDEYLTLEKDLAEQLAQRCGGNPLFAHQLLEEWAGAGVLVDRGGLRYGLARGVQVEQVLPSSTEALLMEKVRRFVARTPQPDRTRWALKLAALAGAEAPVALLEAVLGPTWARELLTSSSLLHQDGATWRFDHQLMQEALRRAAQGEPDASQLHITLARAWLSLERRGIAGSELRMARHLLEGGRAEDALERCLRVAEDAWRSGRVSDQQEAAQLSERAAQAVGLATRDPRTVAARRLRALALQRRGHLEEAARIHEALLAQTDRTPDPVGRGQHLRDLGYVWLPMGDLPAAEGNFREALELARGHFDSTGMAGAQRGLAEVLLRRGEALAARKLLEEAVGWARRAGDTEELPWILSSLARARLQAGGNLRAEEALAREALDMAEKLGNDELIGSLQQLLAEMVKLRGDLATARMRYRTCARYFAEKGLADPAASALLNVALVELTLGRPDAAILGAEDASRWLAAAPSHWLRPVAVLYQAVALAQLGELENARQRFDQAVGLGLGQMVDVDFAAPLGQLALLASRGGAPELARASAELSARVWEKLGDAGEARKMRSLRASI